MAESTNVQVKAKQTSSNAPSPFALPTVESLRQEIDRVFDEVATSWPFGRRAALRGLWPAVQSPSPAVEMTEKNDAYTVAVEVPGMSESEVEVTLGDGMITIAGEKKEAKEEKREGYHFSERHYGSFQRTFGLPDGIDRDKAAASLKNGVLTVTLPKTAEARENLRKVAVKAA